MATFLLVHGGWHGGWAWDRVVPKLDSNDKVYAPTLTGLAERANELSPAVNLDTHVLDIVNLAESQDLTEIILVAHSYGGMVATTALDQLGDRVRSIVYLDGFVPTDGDSLIGLTGWPTPEGLEMPAPPAAYFGLVDPDAAWIDSKLTPHPSATATQQARVSTGAGSKLPKTYVAATGWEGVDHFRSNLARARSDAGWTAIEVPGSHDLMIDKATEVADILTKVAQQADE